MNEVETYVNLDDPENDVAGQRGTSGRIKVTKYKESPLTKSVLAAGSRALGGLPILSNPMDLKASAFQTQRSASGDVYGPPVRSTSWDSYLLPELTKPSPNVKLDQGGTFLNFVYSQSQNSAAPSPTYVDALTSSDRVKVYGVKYLSNGMEPRIAYARNEVIMAAGLMETSKLLQVAGVGDANKLRSKKVTPVVNLPQVGRNLVDKYTWSPMQASSVTPLPIYANSTRGPFQVDGTWPSWCWNPMIIPEFNNVSATSMINMNENQGPGGTIAYSAIVQFVRSRAVGYIDLTDNNPLTRPHWVTNAFRDPLDVAMALDVFSAWRKILNEMRTIPGLQNLAETAPGLSVVPLSNASDPTSFDRAAALKYIGTNANLVAQGTGTCRMSRTAADGVVDSNYKVWGTQNVRVIDTSIHRQPATQAPSGFVLSHVHRLYALLKAQYPATVPTPAPQVGAASSIWAQTSMTMGFAMILTVLVLMW